MTLKEPQLQLPLRARLSVEIAVGPKGSTMLRARVCLARSRKLPSRLSQMIGDIVIALPICNQIHPVSVRGDTTKRLERDAV